MGTQNNSRLIYYSPCQQLGSKHVRHLTLRLHHLTILCPVTPFKTLYKMLKIEKQYPNPVLMRLKNNKIKEKPVTVKGIKTFEQIFKAQPHK